MQANDSIFRAYDIRGVYGKDFDEDFARAFGSGAALKFGATRVVVGWDGRSSSDELSKAVIEGVRAVAPALVIGVSTTPLLSFAVRELDADVGIMVTASHNPGEYNGFKIISREQGIIPGTELRGMAGQAPSGAAQEVQEAEAVLPYVQRLIPYAQGIKTPRAVKVDAPPGTWRVLDALHDALGVAFVKETASPDVRYDPDGDRIFFLEQGKVVEPEFVFLLLAEQRGYRSVVHDVRFSRSVAERLGTLGVRSFISKVGRPSMFQAMREHDAEFGGETSGHYYFKEFGSFEAPEVVLLQILTILQQTGKTLSELIEPYRVYFKKDLDIPLLADVVQAFQAVKQRYADGKLSEIDGISVDYPDWWFNLRQSNTEPLLRLTIEAKTEELLDHKVSELREVLGG